MSSYAFVPPKTIPTASTRTFIQNQKPLPFFSVPSSSQLHGLLDGSTSTDVIMSKGYLTRLFIETLIKKGVPAFVTILTLIISFGIFSFFDRKKKDEDDVDDSRNRITGGRGLYSNAVTELYDDLYDDPERSGAGGDGGGSKLLQRLFGGGKKRNVSDQRTVRNIGIPKEEYISIENLNDKYSSYDYSITKAIDSKSKAASTLRAKSFQKAFQRALSTETEITGEQKRALLETEKIFLQDGSKIMKQLLSSQRKFANINIEEEMSAMSVEVGQIDVTTNSTTTKSTTSSKKKKKKNKKQKEVLLNQLQDTNKELIQLELQFMRNILKIMGPERANGIRASILGNIESGAGDGLPGGLVKGLQQRPLLTVLETIGYNNTTAVSPDDKHNQGVLSSATSEKNIFVAEFAGDVIASQVDSFREEVTAILRNAKGGVDEVVVILQSGGGTVTGYGLAAGQLLRLKEHDLKLTICVEEVAASGGYMMCCVADRIVASPFAVLGSIGVITQIPNFYERLNKEGIEFQTITAGKYKRTVTPFNEVTEEGIEKTKSDIQAIFTQFKSFVQENRPQLVIDDVATGETWLGNDALEKGLCDEIKTVDDVLLDYVDSGHNVYGVQYNDNLPSNPISRYLPDGVSSTRSRGLVGGIVQGMTRLLLNNILPTIQKEIRANLFQLGGGTTTRMKQCGGDNDIRYRYMMIDNDDTINKFRTQD